MDYRQTLLVLLSVLLCSSQGLTETPTEASLVQTPSETSTEMTNKLNLPIFELIKTVIRLDEMNNRIMTRLDEMNSETVKRFEENNSTMFSLFDKLDKKTQKKSEEMDNKLMKRLDEMNSETVKHFDETDLHVKSIEISITNSSEINLNKYLTLSQDMKKFSTRLDEIEARLQRQEDSSNNQIKQSIKHSTNRKEKQFVLFTDEWKTWQDAYDDCIKRNMMLASIESEEENNKVVSLLKNIDRGTHFWLSGTDLGHTGRYVWKSTGRDVTYNQWAQGQPSNSVWSEVEHCMWVYWGDMRWYAYDSRCSSPLYYICQH